MEKRRSCMPTGSGERDIDRLVEFWLWSAELGSGDRLECRSPAKCPGFNPDPELAASDAAGCTKTALPFHLSSGGNVPPELERRAGAPPELVRGIGGMLASKEDRASGDALGESCKILET